MQSPPFKRALAGTAATTTLSSSSSTTTSTTPYAPRRDDESEGLSMALAMHRVRAEAWQTVLMRVMECDMQMRGAQAMHDMRSEYAGLGTADEVLARAEMHATSAAINKDAGENV